MRDDEIPFDDEIAMDEAPTNFSYTHPRPIFRAYTLRPKLRQGKKGPTWDDVGASISQKNSRELANESTSVNALYHAGEHYSAALQHAEALVGNEMRLLQDNQRAAVTHFCNWVNEQEDDLQLSWTIVSLSSPDREGFDYVEDWDRDYRGQRRTSRSRSRSRPSSTWIRVRKQSVSPERQYHPQIQSIQIVMQQLRDPGSESWSRKANTAQVGSQRANAGARRRREERSPSIVHRRRRSSSDDLPPTFRNERIESLYGSRYGSRYVSGYQNEI